MEKKKSFIAFPFFLSFFCKSNCISYRKRHQLNAKLPIPYTSGKFNFMDLK